MKLFIKFLVEPTGIVDHWYETITEQVKNLIQDFRSIDMAPFDPYGGQPILAMEQEDTRARFVMSPNQEGRFFLTAPMFILRYEWEQEELDEYCRDYELEPIVIPPSERDEDYIFLCSFDPYAENLNLDFSRIPRDPDCDEDCDESFFCIKPIIHYVQITMATNKIYTLGFSYPQNPENNGKHRIEVIQDGLKRTEIHSDWLEDDKWQIGDKTEITYNEDKLPVAIHEFAYQDEDWQHLSTIKYQYDKRGRKIEEVQLDGDNTPETRLIYDYHLDNEGNGHVIISEEEWHCNSWRKVSEYMEQYVEQKIVSRIQHSRRQTSGTFTPEWNDEYTTYSYEIAAGLYQETMITSRLGLTKDATELGDWEEKTKTVFEKHGSSEIWTQYSKQGKEWVARKKQELTKSDNITIAQKDHVYRDGDWVLEYEMGASFHD